MSKPIPAVVQPAVDLARLNHEWDALDGREQRTLAEIRVAKGKLLIQARKAFPKTGNDGAWSKHLEKWRIAGSTARDYMRLAGYVESTSTKVGEAEQPKTPTYVDAGIKKPRTEALIPVARHHPEKHRRAETVRIVWLRNLRCAGSSDSGRLGVRQCCNPSFWRHG